MLLGFLIFFPLPLTLVINSPCSTTLSIIRALQRLCTESQLGVVLIRGDRERRESRSSIVRAGGRKTGKPQVLLFASRSQCLAVPVATVVVFSWCCHPLDRSLSHCFSPNPLQGGLGLPEFGSDPDLSPARCALAAQGTGSVEIFARAVGFGGRSRLFVAFAFSFPYYSPDKPRRSLWTLLGRLKMLCLIKILLVIIACKIQQRAKLLKILITKFWG